MYISKTKTYNILPLSQVKEDLRIAEDDSTFDNELSNLIKSAIAYTEKCVQSDLVPTVNVLEDYKFFGTAYRINESNITINSITVTNNIETTPVITSVSGSSYYIEKYHSFTVIKFKTGINAEKISINYSSGYSVLPEDLKRAIILYIGYLLDVDKNLTVTSNFRDSKTFDRLIAYYTNHIV
jgi:hypothetical protein